VKLGAIGDVANTLPLANRLRRAWPEVHLTWLIAPLAHGLVKGHPAIDRFLICDLKARGGWRRAIRDVRAARFDLALDLQRIQKSGWLTLATGAPRRLGFDRGRCKELSYVFTNERIPANTNPGVTVAQYLEFADHLGASESAPEWRIPFVRWDAELRGGRPQVTLGLGASKPANRWPDRHWEELVRSLIHDQKLSVHLCGGPEDTPLGAKLARISGTVMDWTGRLNLRESAGLIEASDLFIGGDTGLLHIAVGVGTEVLAIFGAADPNRTGPFLKPDSVLRELVPCAPCRKRRCPVPGHPCLERLQPSQVEEAAAQSFSSIS
jgi:ADP-heptose:LPS heptosyltransferase